MVGAGDAVTANLTAARAAGADLREAITLANAAASIVIHQCGTTGTADVAALRERCVTGVRAAGEAQNMNGHGATGAGCEVGSTSSCE